MDISGMTLDPAATSELPPAPVIQPATPQAIQAMKTMAETSDAAEYQNPEAPGLAWLKVYSPTGAEITLRTTAFTIFEAIDELAAGITYAANKYQWSPINPYQKAAPVPPVQAPPLNQPAAKAPPPLTPPPLGQINPGLPVAPPAPVPQAFGPSPVVPPAAQTNVGDTGILTVVKVQVAARSDALCQLDLYGPTGKFPQMKMIMDKARLLQIVAPVGFQEANLQPGAMYTGLNWHATWVAGSKLDSQNHPYKNVTKVVPGS